MTPIYDEALKDLSQQEESGKVTNAQAKIYSH